MREKCWVYCSSIAFMVAKGFNRRFKQYPEIKGKCKQNKNNNKYKMWKES